MLTEKEKERINLLRPGFNIVKENKDYNYISSRRVEVSRVWAKRLLNVSTILNVLSIIIMLLALIAEYNKPEPDFYASTPTGKIYPLKNITRAIR